MPIERNHFKAAVILISGFIAFAAVDSRAENCQSRHQFNIASSADPTQNCNIYEGFDNLLERASTRLDFCASAAVERTPALRQYSGLNLNTTVYVDHGKVSTILTGHALSDPQFATCINQAFTDLGITPSLPNATLKGKISLTVPKEIPHTTQSYSSSSSVSASNTYGGTGEGGSYIGECGVRETPPSSQNESTRSMPRN